MKQRRIKYKYGYRCGNGADQIHVEERTRIMRIFGHDFWTDWRVLMRTYDMDEAEDMLDDPDPVVKVITIK